MIGQTKLIDRIEKYNITTFPKSNLFIGEFGCGKHSLIEYFCDKFKIDCVDISNDISNELLMNLYQKTQSTAYIININVIAQKHKYINKENAILKFIEEPPTNAFIFVLAEHDFQIIDTIKNRCVKWEFFRYTIDELKQFKVFDDDKLYLYSILNTPGKLLNSESEEYYETAFELCNTIIHNINRANISNTLSLDRHLEKYNCEVLLKILKFLLYNEYCKTYEEKFFNAYDLTINYIDKLHVLNVSSKYLFDNFILDLKSIYD